MRSRPSASSQSALGAAQHMDCVPSGFLWAETQLHLLADMTRRVGNLGAVMVKERLTAPPREAYSLHRKLSGAFLANIKLGAVRFSHWQNALGNRSCQWKRTLRQPPVELGVHPFVHVHVL